MFTLSNLISCSRAITALLFIQTNIYIRLGAIGWAMLSDVLDGYLARKNNSSSKVGAVLDPAMDKFFVYFALLIFYMEGRLEVWQILTLLSRDIALCIFGLYLLIYNRPLKPKSIKWGKITTAFQFFALIVLCFNRIVPWYGFMIFVIFGLLSLKELFQNKEARI